MAATFGFRSLTVAARSWLLIPLLLSMVGCGVTARSVSVPNDAAAPGQSTRSVSGGEDAARARLAADGEVPDAYLYSRDPERLARELRLVCARADPSGRFLRGLVADLYFSEVPPAVATGALLDADCANPSEIVEEMLARGGAESREGVLDQVRQRLGNGVARQIESAAAAGLARHAGRQEVAAMPLSGDSADHGMLYFPSAGQGSRLVTAMALNQLYEETLPGYGVYTFVLMGGGFDRSAGADMARYSELFRMIETYVSGARDEHTPPSSEAHVFLIPIRPGDPAAALVDQADSDLSDLMRRHFGEILRHAGHRRLAARLEQGAGPFLVAASEPRLLPSTPNSPRLVVDLSGMGPEHIYGIVDAYDRPISAGMRGRSESLGAIRERLLGLPVAEGEAGWIFVIGPLADRSPDRPASLGWIETGDWHARKRFG